MRNERLKHKLNAQLPFKMTLIWQKEQKFVCALVLAIVNEAQTA